MKRCEVDGTAVVQQLDDGELRWLQADPHIHVADELVKSPHPFLTDAYAVGEWCEVHQAWIAHRRRDATTADEGAR